MNQKSATYYLNGPLEQTTIKKLLSGLEKVRTWLQNWNVFFSLKKEN